jgi:site-specific recombinase XerC
VSSFPCLVRSVSSSGQDRYSLGERLVDRYLEFVAGKCRPNTLRAVAFDLKAFFGVVGKDPVEVTAADVFDFLADQRGDRAVVRLADRESGLSARTIARRLSSVSGLYAYLVARAASGSISLSSPSAPNADIARTLPWLLSSKAISAGEYPGFVRDTPGRFL